MTNLGQAALLNGSNQDRYMREIRRLGELLAPHMAYGMELEKLFVSEDQKLVASLKSTRAYDGYHFTYDVPVHPLAVQERPRRVAQHISEEAAKVLRASIEAGDVETS